ncbi:MAG: HK97 family phage prohead protease [Nitrosomonas sp.]|uniref:HK97 family phage prohead protease n=1 Tax=Nitrosomonas sp. TaxID=42353 RepID=UPI0025E35227|nr:HK97 family phage prohead protease [Nitrosomonas sp.]MBY0474209.1 HK97 family phage prohead protease [Nitrosomonas sp.]
MLAHKTLSLSNCQIKTDGEEGSFSGYASVFGLVDTYGDTILPGAYKETLQKNGFPKMFLMHNSFDLPIGKWKSVSEDDYGLHVEGELTMGMSRANDAYAAMKHGTLDGLSIGYMLKKGDYTPSVEVEGGRIIKNVSLLGEISPVVFPADSSARIDLSSVKSEISEIETIRDFEYFLRDAGGFSKGLTNALISRARVLFGRRDDGQDEIDAKSAQVLNEALERIKRAIPTTL